MSDLFDDPPFEWNDFEEEPDWKKDNNAVCKYCGEDMLHWFNKRLYDIDEKLHICDQYKTRQAKVRLRGNK